MRYPDELYEPSVEEAEEYLQMVKSVKVLVRSKIHFS